MAVFPENLFFTVKRKTWHNLRQDVNAPLKTLSACKPLKGRMPTDTAVSFRFLHGTIIFILYFQDLYLS